MVKGWSGGKRGWVRRGLRLGALLLAVLAVALALLAFIPLRAAPLAYRPLPAMTFAQTVAAVEERIRLAPEEIRPECRGQMLQHGRPTERVFVLMHGLSNCPAQFRRFGELLYRRGHNVVIPRLPYHGQRDRLTEEWKLLSAQQMLDSANNAVDVARNLGRKVTVVGLSVNGTVAAWLAQNRADVDRVVLIAPLLAPSGVPEAAITPLSRLVYRLPNRFMWWDPVKKAAAGGDNAYPRFPTHAIAQVLRISGEVLEQAASEAPRVRSILVVTTAVDTTISAPLVAALARRWRDHGGQVRTYEFPAAEHVGHDCIDPSQPDQKVGLVYPRLLSLLGA